MIRWLPVLNECAKNMRAQILPLIGTPQAKIGHEIGAGGDIQKQIDLVAEKALIQTLNEHNVSCILISEESGFKKIGSESSDYYVTTDPVDGTTNAVRGLPFLAISIAVSKKPYLPHVLLALVNDVLHDVTYTAEKGKGAFKNQKPINPSTTNELEESVVGIDISPFKNRELFNHLIRLLEKTSHLRHLGANALELCYVADGTIDAFIDLRGKLRVTDIAAAQLILREAGGVITTLDGDVLNVPLDAAQRVSFIATANHQLSESIRRLASQERPIDR